jgi:hypothetical protein
MITLRFAIAAVLAAAAVAGCITYFVTLARQGKSKLFVLTSRPSCGFPF